APRPVPRPIASPDRATVDSPRWAGRSASGWCCEPGGMNMGLRLTWATGALLLIAQSAAADISVTGTLVSDYDFRGISQSAGDPALQASIDYSHSLFYASAWASQIDFDGTSEYGDGSTERVRVDGNIELDLVAGFAGEFSEGGIRWDVGA